MPLVRIDLAAGRSAEVTQAIADAIHHAIVSTCGIPERDRFQIITEHPASHIIAADAGLGFERSAGVIMIQIFTQRGRPAETKIALYRRIAEELERAEVAGADVFIGYVENGPEDWSFGFGEAQYLNGELAIPQQMSTGVLGL